MAINNFRWIVVALLFFATSINYLDRQIIGLLKPLLEKEFLWSETDFAHIVMAFTAAYAAGLLFFGWLIDRMGTKIGYALSIIIWSIAGMLHAVAKSVTGFSMARIGLGIGEAGNYPAAMKSVAEWFPDRERGLATGIFNAGTSVGVVVALALVPWILSNYGWQEVFWITGASGFVWLIFWIMLYEVPSRQMRLSKTELDLIRSGQHNEILPAPTPWVKLFSASSTWAYVTGKFLIDPIYWFFLFWLPSYFSSTFQLDLKKPSIPLMLIYASTTVGSIGGGYFSSLLISRMGMSTLQARKTALFIFAVCELSILFLPYITEVWTAVGLLSFAVAVHQAWATNIFTSASDMFPKENVSSVVGIGGMMGALGGILFPMLVGYLLDAYKATGNLVGGYNVLFTVCGFTYLVAWLIIHALTRRKT